MSTNLQQLLISRTEWFSRGIMNHVRREHAYITPAQSRLLMHMAGRPASMSELARRLAISRQAVHKTVAELVRRGILEVRTDPERRNQRLVVYTAKGKQVNRSGVRIIESIEQRIAKRLGRDKLETLRELLAADWD